MFISIYRVNFNFIFIRLDYYLSLEVEKKEVINSLYKWLDLDIVGWEYIGVVTVK